MSQEKQGKKMSPAEKSLAGKDDKVPAALSDEDLDKVAGGFWSVDAAGNIATPKLQPDPIAGPAKK